jgi:serine/threonine protein kinase, bacterial
MSGRHPGGATGPPDTFLLPIRSGNPCRFQGRTKAVPAECLFSRSPLVSVVPSSEFLGTTERPRRVITAQPKVVKRGSTAATTLAPPSQYAPPTPPKVGGISRRTTVARVVGGIVLLAALFAVAIRSIGHQDSNPSQTVLPFTGLNWPAGVAVDTIGDVYIADQNTNRVQKLAAGSSTPTVLPFSALSGPAGVTVDSANDVYVTDNLNNRVLELAAGSSTPTVLPFSGLSPNGVAVDSAGNLYITDSDNNRVVKLPAG